MPLRIPEAFCYIVRQGPNPELMFSLRSVHAHFPGTPVFIVGDMPDWAHGVEYLKGNLRVDKPLNVWDNLVILSRWDAVPENIVVMNDDFYITAPVKKIPVLYRGTLEAHITSLGGRTDWWARSLHHAAAILGPDALSYELHTPFPCKRSLLAKALSIDSGMHPPQWRTLYGNQHHTGGQKAGDVKISRPLKALPEPFASTHDVTFRFTKPQLEKLYPDPSPFER